MSASGFHVVIERLPDGRYRTSFMYFTDLRQEVEGDDVPLVRIADWLKSGWELEVMR